VSVPDEADVVGVGVGFAELLLAVLLLPPQPIMVKAAATNKRKRPVCNVEFILLRTVYSSFGGLSVADSRAALIFVPSLHHFDIQASRDKCLRVYRSTMHYCSDGPLRSTVLILKKCNDAKCFLVFVLMRGQKNQSPGRRSMQLCLVV
jgi:hypothetical protein